MAVNTGTTFGHGAIFRYDTSATAAPTAKIASPTTLAGVINVSKTQSRASIDETDHESDQMEFMAGLQDPGEVTLELNMEQANYNVLRGNLEAASAAAKHQWEIEFPNTGTTTNACFTFLGFVTNLGLPVPQGDKLTLSATFKIAAKPFWTDAT